MLGYYHALHSILFDGCRLKWHSTFRPGPDMEENFHCGFESEFVTCEYWLQKLKFMAFLRISKPDLHAKCFRYM